MTREVLPASTTRERIREANRYRPRSKRRAQRGYSDIEGPGFRPTVKHPGDKVIDERGQCWEVR